MSCAALVWLATDICIRNAASADRTTSRKMAVGRTNPLHREICRSGRIAHLYGMTECHRLAVERDLQGEVEQRRTVDLRLRVVHAAATHVACQHVARRASGGAHRLCDLLCITRHA